MSELTERALVFATEAHAGQVRKNKDPFIVHPKEVAQLVEESGGSDEEIAAAFLHDTVEDTPTTLEDIIQYFGEEIGDIVDGLTDPIDFSGLLIPIRKANQARRVRGKSDSVKRVKLADQISNVRSIAVDALTTWSSQKCLHYITGAKLIATECQGVSDYLNDRFQEVYQVALFSQKFVE